MAFLRRSRSPKRPIYKEAAGVLKSRRHSEALAWIFENLKPEAARMLETCLSAYGPAEALRWVSYREKKKEPIEKDALAAFTPETYSLEK